MFLFDIGVGLLLTAILGNLAGLEPSLPLTLAGIAGSLIPDWDMIPHLIRKRGKLDQWTHLHRDISHYPLITVPIFALAAGCWLGLWYGILTALTTIAHYLRDVPEPGWGIRLGWPFYTKYIAYRAVENEPPKFHFWTAAEQDNLASSFGNPKWASESKRWHVDAIVFFVGLVITVVWFFAV